MLTDANLLQIVSLISQCRQAETLLPEDLSGIYLVNKYSSVHNERRCWSLAMSLHPSGVRTVVSVVVVERVG